MIYSEVIVPTFSMPEAESFAVVQLTPLYLGAKPCT
jgi:hypothetical protein